MDKNRLRELVDFYKGSVPRYTSYPTAVEFNTDFQAEHWNKIIGSEKVEFSENSSFARSIEDPFSLYLHIPFCKKLCFFCACNKLITNDYAVTLPYIEALVDEAKGYQQFFGDRPLRQLHLGGGTPNYLRPADLLRLLKSITSLFGERVADFDYSMEVDPRTTLVGHLEAVRELSFNRVSMGVQDFDPLVQTTINRVQPVDQTKRLIEEARKLGFSGVNIDLIYGLPNQTENGFFQTLQEVKKILPDRIALYGYAHVTWLHKVQKSFHRARIPTPEERVELFLLAVDELLSAGYRYIGLDHFALESDKLSVALDQGNLNRNFMGYTTHKNAEIVGLGASAISSTQAGFAQNHKDIGLYQKNVHSIARGLQRSFDDGIRAEVIEQLLCNGKVNVASVLSDWKVDEKYFSKELEAVASHPAEVVEVAGSVISLTEVGRVFSRNIAAEFDVYLQKHSKDKKFSQAV